MVEEEDDDEEGAAHISSIGTRRPRRRPRTSPSASSSRAPARFQIARLAVRRTAARHHIARASRDVIAGEKASTTTSRSSAVTSRRAPNERVSRAVTMWWW